MILTFRPERFLPGTNIMRHRNKYYNVNRNEYNDSNVPAGTFFTRNEYYATPALKKYPLLRKCPGRTNMYFPILIRDVWLGYATMSDRLITTGTKTSLLNLKFIVPGAWELGGVFEDNSSEFILKELDYLWDPYS